MPVRLGRGKALWCRQSQRGVTLNELIFVVVLVAILAGLAIVSTTTLITRTKYSRVKEDHRVLARALQNYQMDYSQLPETSHQLSRLERPTAYLASVPHDPFTRGNTEQEYLYVQPNLPGVSFILISKGPDGDYDLPGQLSWMVGLDGTRGGRLGPEKSVDDDPGTDPGQTAATLGQNTPTLTPAVNAAGQANRPRPLMPSELQRLQEYLEWQGWTPSSKTGNGDVITVIRN